MASLKRYVAVNLPEEVRRDRVVVLREEADTLPGEEAQIDYGHLGYWVDPASGKRRRGVGFVMVCWLAPGTRSSALQLAAGTGQARSDLPEVP